MAKNTKAPAAEAVDDPIFAAEPDTKEKTVTEQEALAAEQAKVDAEAAKAAEEADAAEARVTQGNGPELIALRTIVGMSGKGSVIRPKQGRKSLFRCVDPKERKRLIDIGAAMEQGKDDDSRIIVPR